MTNLNMPMISIITPVLNEEGFIKPFLDHLDEVDSDFELILVDGGSSDRTLEEIAEYRIGFRRRLMLLGSGSGRAKQMNMGARKAGGDILLFLHVDCAIQKDSLLIIKKVMKRDDVIGGGFKQAFFHPDIFLKFGSAFGNLRARLTRTFYGDYGIFLRRDIFEKMGGYDDIPFLEDVEICKKARKFGRLVQLDRYIFTSSRRFITEGVVRLTAIFILAILLNTMGFRPGFLIRYIVDK